MDLTKEFPSSDFSAPDECQNETHYINNPVLDIEPVFKKHLSKIISWERTPEGVLLSDGSARVEIIVVSPDIVRVRLAPNGTFLNDFSYALAQSERQLCEYAIEEDEDAVRIYTNSLCCRLDKSDFKVSFEDIDGTLVNADAQSMHWEENVSAGGYYVYASKSCETDDAFYGLGDKSTELNLRGRRFVNWNTDAYSFGSSEQPLYRTIPFYCGVRNGRSYGMFFDNTFRSFFDFGQQECNKVSFWADGGELRYYYIHGPAMLDVVRRYQELTGAHPLPPKWALGFHQCRWSYFPEAKVKDIARNFRDRRIPCDAIYLDIDYMDGYRCFTWNKKYFPDPKKMISELAEDGFRTVLIIDPGIKVDDNYAIFREGRENNYFCKRADDYPMEGHVWPGRCQFPDFTNPKVRSWWGTLFKDLVDAGVDGVWNDMNEPAVFGSGTFPDDVRHDFDGQQASHRKAHNIYGMQMVRATYEGLKNLRPDKRPFTITRAGYSGVQRYASVWTGDNVASWEHLRIGVIQLQRLSMSGISFCGTDIGGFSGEPDAELFTRWIQMGVFSPFMRAHSAGDTAEREPWSFGPYHEAVNRKFIELRYKLMPYIYSTFWLQYRYHLPVLRPIVVHDQYDPEAQNVQDTFTFGEKILVSPVTTRGTTGKEVYLPAGIWFDYWTGEPKIGQKWNYIAAPIDSMPVLVKAGSVIPESPVMQYVDEFKPEQLSLRMYYTANMEETLLYEDDGVSYEFEGGDYLERKFVVSGSASSMLIVQSCEGSYQTSYKRFHVIATGLPFRPSMVTAGGRQIDFTLMEGAVHFEIGADFHSLEILA